MEVLKKVRKALERIKGFELCEANHADEVVFVKCIDLFNLCGLRFCLWIEVDVWKDGRVEYGVSELHASKMTNGELRKVLSKESGLKDWRVEKLCNDVESAIEGMMESTHASFGMQFERLLPDVEIIDRIYC